MIILISFIITFLTVAIATFSATPQYTASSQVLIEKNYGSNLTGSISYYRLDPEFLPTQLQVIRSANVAHRVVEKLQLDTRYRQYFLKDTDSSVSFIASWKKSISAFIMGLLPSSGNEAEEEQGGEEKKESLLVTEPLSDADIIASMIRKNLWVKPVPVSKTVTISYSHKDPGMAQLVVNTVVQAYIDELLEIKLSTSSYSLQWMTVKADEERLKLEKSERALQQYMREHDLVTVENKLAVYPEKLAEFSKQLSAAQAEQKEYEALYAQIEATGKDYKNIETIPIFAGNKVLQDLRNKVYAVEQKIKDLSKKYGYKHPVMIQAKSERALLLKEQRFEVNRIIESTRKSYELAKSREENMKKLLAESKSGMLDVNESFMQYTIMKREVDMNRVLYDNLTSKIKTANVTEQAQDVKVWVVQKADLPIAPSSPKKKRDLTLGLILGLLGGVGLAYFIEYLNNSIETAEELERRFRLTVLGSVEELKEKDETIETHIVNNSLSPLAESYRLIRSNLLLSSPDHPPRTILITSMTPKEGKTATTANLARILAQNEKKVLIIDCDMRRPRMHSLFSKPNVYGLSNYLTGNTEQTLVQDISNEEVQLISAGSIPPNPAELLNSVSMQQLIVKMGERYDFVLLDSPPVQSVTDSLTLSSLVDGTILVVRAGSITSDILENGLKKLHEVNAHCLGFVLNGFNKTSGVANYYGYYEYYSKETSKTPPVKG
jgi:capsular exopolysaccharide synthesis family protein